MGILHLEQGRRDEARAALAGGEAILRELGEAAELGKLLCTRGELECRCGDMPASTAALREAETLAEKVGAGPESDLGRRLATLRQVITARS